MWFLGKRNTFVGEIITFGWWMITFEGPQCMWTNPSKKSRQGSDPPPHPGNACILGKNGPETPPLHRDIQTVSYRPSSLSCSIKVKLVHRYIVLTRSPPLSLPLSRTHSAIFTVMALHQHSIILTVISLQYLQHIFNVHTFYVTILHILYLSYTVNVSWKE